MKNVAKAVLLTSAPKWCSKWMLIANTVRMLESDVWKVSIACLWRTVLLILISSASQKAEFIHSIYENVAVDNTNFYLKRYWAWTKRNIKSRRWNVRLSFLSNWRATNQVQILAAVFWDQNIGLIFAFIRQHVLINNVNFMVENKSKKW